MWLLLTVQMAKKLTVNHPEMQYFYRYPSNEQANVSPQISRNINRNQNLNDSITHIWGQVMMFRNDHFNMSQYM